MAGDFGFGGVVGAAFSAVSGSVLETAKSLVTVIGFLALAVGIALAYVLPLIPFLRFYFGVIAWVLSLIEAVLAMPLFLAMQVVGEERGLVTQGARSGYLLLLHAVLRPALMVFGLVLGYFVFVAAIGLLNWQYEAHLEAVNESGRLGGLTFLVAFLIYAVVAYIVANVSFKAIDVIPQEGLGVGSGEGCVRAATIRQRSWDPCGGRWAGSPRCVRSAGEVGDGFGVGTWVVPWIPVVVGAACWAVVVHGRWR